MSIWSSILTGTLVVALSLAALCVLLAALLHVRFEAAWFGMWTGDLAVPHEKFLRVEFGFPGFMHAWRTTGSRGENAQWPEAGTTSSGGGMTERGGAGAENDPATHAPAGPPGAERDALRRASASAKTPGKTSAQTAGPEPDRPAPESAPPHHDMNVAAKPRKDRNRFRKALFRLVTDGPAWRLASGYFLRVAGRGIRLLGLRAELSAGHPDPAWLGRFAGRWYAVSSMLPPGRVVMNFRFQDRNPSFGARVTGGFSVLGFLWFCAAVLLTFPIFRLGHRALYGWRHRDFVGWREWTYRQIQKI